MNWEEKLEERVRIEEDDRASLKPAPQNYVGVWTEQGYITSNGSLWRPQQLWEFTTQYKYMCKLANLKDKNGLCLLDYNAKKLERCLEIGCDWGHCFPVFESCFEEVHGVEIVDWAAERGQKHGRKIERGMMENMPYEDDYFNAVFSNHVLEHTFDLRVCMEELIRVSKPGAYWVHTLPCRIDKKVWNKGMHEVNITYERWLEIFDSYGVSLINHFFMWNHNQEDWTFVGAVDK